MEIISIILIILIETMYLYDKIAEYRHKLSNIENEASERTQTKKFTLED